MYCSVKGDKWQLQGKCKCRKLHQVNLARFSSSGEAGFKMTAERNKNEDSGPCGSERRRYSIYLGESFSEDFQKNSLGARGS